MAAPSSGSIIRVAGDLIYNPVNLGLTPPFGGTYLGTCRDKRLIENPVLREVRSNGVVRDVIYCGERPVFKAVVRYPDADFMLYSMFGAVNSGSSGVGYAYRPEGASATTRPGSSLSNAKGFKLMFAARAYAAHPSIMMYNAVPAIDEAHELALSLNDEYSMAVAFHLTPDSNGRVYANARLANLTV